MLTTLWQNLGLQKGMGGRLCLLVLGFCIVIVVSMWTVLAYQLSYERQQTIEMRLRENDNLTLAFGEHVQRTLATATFTLKDIEEEYKRQGKHLGLAQYFRDRREELGPFSVLSVVDENGDLVLSSAPFTQPQNFRNLENTQFHLRNTTQDIFIAKPRPGSVTGRSTIYVTRRMNKADGSFNGNTGIGLAPDYLSRFYDRIDLGPGSVVALIGLDGVIRGLSSGEPTETMAISQDAISTPLFRTHLRQGAQGYFRWEHPSQGAAYLYSYRAVNGYPLVALVSIPEAVTLARFEQRQRTYLWWAGGASSAIFAFGILLSFLLLRQARTSQALRESEERVQAQAKRADAFLQATPDPVLIVNQNGEIVLVNSQAEKTFGYAESELLGQPVEKLVPAGAAQAHISARQAFAETPSVRPMDAERAIFARRKDGSEFPVDISLSPVDMPEGMLVIGQVRDITERKRAEDALRENFEFLERIFSTTHFCVVYLDCEFNFIRVNRAYADACGHSPDYFAGKNHFALYPSNEVEEIFRGVVSTGTPYTTHARAFAFPDHPERVTYWDWTLQPLRHAGGTVEGLLFTLVDVTAREHAERSARDAGRRLQLAVRAGKIGFWDREIATGRAYYSSEWKHQLGYREDEIEGHYDAWRSRVHPDDAERIVARLDGYLKGRFRDYAVEYRLRHKDGSYRWIYACGEVVRDSADVQQRIVGCQVDITDLKLTQQHLESRVAQAELLNVLANCVNEAKGPNDAMAACLARLCSSGHWTIGRIGYYQAAGAPRYPDSSVWHATDLIRYEAFIRQSEQAAGYVEGGALIAVIFQEKKPVWLPDLRHEQRFVRRTAALAHGLQAAFGFPIVVDGGVIAFMEFFADAPRPVDLALMAGSEIIGAQIARLIERHRAAHAQAQLAAITTSSNDAIFGRDVKGKIVFWNLAAERLYAWKAHEVIGRTIDLLIPPERRGKYPPIEDVLKRSESASLFERVHVRRDGQRLPVQVTLSALKDAQGTVYGVSNTVRDMSDLKRHEQELHDYVQRLRHLTHQLRTVEENERRAIARELHDRIGQNLSTLNLMLGMLGQRRSAAAAGVIDEQVVEMQSVLKSTMEHTRSLMSELRPLALEEFGLCAALKDLAGDFARKAQILVNVTGADITPRLPFITEIAIYRIAQEALTNIAKHARASTAVLELKATATGVELSITDNGIGCDIERVSSSNRTWGLTTMQERAEAAGIEIDIESVPGYGTRVQLSAERAGL